MNGWQQKNKLWTPEEEQLLKAPALAGKSAAEIAADLGRTENAVASRAYQFAFSLRHTRRLVSTLSNDTIATCLYDKWRTVAQIRSRLGVKTTAGWLAEALQQMAKAGAMEKALRAN